MIRFQTISTSDVQHYQFMENLLIAAFPPEEYRELKELREYTDRTGNFYNNIIFDNETPVGFITYWDFNDFYYVEHFAIDPTLRNGGYGKKTLDYLCKELDRPIVLEVEMPVEGDGKAPYQFLSETRIYSLGKRIQATTLQARRRLPTYVSNGVWQFTM